MLPRLDSFKRAIFTKRICLYNETFGGFAGRRNEAYICHEATSGRNDENIAFAFYQFLKSQHNVQTIVIWVDTVVHKIKIGHYSV